MKLIKHLSVTFLGLLTIACNSNLESKKNDFAIITNAKKGEISNQETLKVSLQNINNHTVDSVVFTLNGQRIKQSLPLSDFKLGKHSLEALIYSGDEKLPINTSVTILNSESPKMYSYEIINTYPHDITSYTQGLEFYNDTLYESTGLYKNSKLRKVNYKIGSVYKNINLDDAFFGEGLTILNSKIYQLTWQEGSGFVYDVNTFKKTSSFNYGNSKEGWGLCHNDKYLFKSDGTENIWLLNPNTLAEDDFIQVYTNKGKIIGINEMEWIDGLIYANRYQKDGVAIINPKNGAVIGVIDFSPLKKLVTQHNALDVLNGIAYNPKTKTVFVTGKNWDKLFEVKIIEK